MTDGLMYAMDADGLLSIVFPGMEAPILLTPQRAKDLYALLGELYEMPPACRPAKPQC